MRAARIVKQFPGLRALDNVDLDVRSGEIVALVGHNGSGKSTLVKILAGIYKADEGEVSFAGDGGETTQLHIIHQDLGLVGELSTVENLRIAHGRGAGALSPTRRKEEIAHANRVIGRFGEGFDVTQPVASLAPAQRSIVAIGRALDGWSHARNVLILDEPTEALHATETEVLFDAVRRVAAEGAGVIFISHRLDEVLALADRAVVLRDGQKVADVPTAGLGHGDLVEYVTGASASTSLGRPTDRPLGDVVLDVRGLSGAGMSQVDLTLRAGEVVGVAGVLGSGRDLLPALVFGGVPSSAERYVLEGRPYQRRSPAESVRRGMAFVAGDRARLGGVTAMNARENMTLPELKSITGPVGTIRPKLEKALAKRLVERYDIRPARPEQAFSQFSGGNQQKIVFAKWLRNDPRVLVLEEPTQGVDIGAKQAIYDEIDAAAARGVAVLVCSSDAKELVRLCDRVVVMRSGTVAAELRGDELTEAALVLHGHGLVPASEEGEERSS